MTSKPTNAQLSAGFIAAKKEVNLLIQKLVPAWALGMINITDAEIHAISDLVVSAALNAPPEKP